MYYVLVYPLRFSVSHLGLLGSGLQIFYTVTIISSVVAPLEQPVMSSEPHSRAKGGHIATEAAELTFAV